MLCRDVEAGLDDYAEGTLRSRLAADIEAHLIACPGCRRLADGRRSQEAALRNLLAPVGAPPALLSRVHEGLERGVTRPHGVKSLLPRLQVDVSPRGITRIRIAPGRPSVRQAAGSLAARVVREIREYLEGGRAFFDLPWDQQGIDPFQRRVLEAARRIPFGEVRSYGWLAEAIGEPGAARAVGNALGRNPVPLFIPCHRIVKRDGTIGVYAFGSALKADLLRLEQATTPYVGCPSTRVLCQRGCPQERRIGEVNRIHFASVGEALSSGYRACKVCRPARP